MTAGEPREPLLSGAVELKDGALARPRRVPGTAGIALAGTWPELMADFYREVQRMSKSPSYKMQGIPLNWLGLEPAPQAHPAAPTSDAASKELSAPAN